MGTQTAPLPREASDRSPSRKSQSPMPGPQHTQRPAPRCLEGGFRALGRAAAAAALFAVSLTLHLWFSSSALRWSVRQALSSVGSHFRVNIISDGHNRLE